MCLLKRKTLSSVQFLGSPEDSEDHAPQSWECRC